MPGLLILCRFLISLPTLLGSLRPILDLCALMMLRREACLALFDMTRAFLALAIVESYLVSCSANLPNLSLIV